MKRSRSTDATVSLFPFLSVLLCTMGTLAMIFVVVARRTSNDDAPIPIPAESPRATDASEIAKLIAGGSLDSPTDSPFEPPTDAPTDAPTDSPVSPLDAEYDAALARVDAATLDDLRSESESLAWFLDELDDVRERTRESLDKERERLANAEKALADLRSESVVARRKLEALEAERIAEPGEDAASLEAKIADLDAEIARLQAETTALRDKNRDAAGKRSYSIVPYQGKKGTFRRPIYVECRADGVFLQPEGVRFSPNDFLLAKYPGNPFDAGLRAAASRYVETEGPKAPNGDAIAPYPLLIVRPGGAEYYYPAVAALASWGGEYGYEFVADDEEIAYPPADPALAEAVKARSDFARKRLEAQLAAILSARGALRAAAFASNGSNGGAPGGLGGGSTGGSGGRFGGRFGAEPNAAALGIADSTLTNRLGGVAKLGSAGAKVATLGGGSANGATFGSLGGKRSATAAEVLGTNGGALDAATLPAYSGQFAQYSTGGAGGGSANGENSGNGANGGTFASGANSASGDGSASSAISTNSANGANGTFSANGANSASANGSANSANSAGAAGAASGSGSSSTTPFVALLTAPSNGTGANESPVDANKALGNTTFAAGATGTSADGTLASNGATSSKIAPVEKPKTGAEPERKEAIRVSDELRRRANAGLERGITVRVSANKLVFPKQPGFRRQTIVEIPDGATLDAETVRNELLDALVLCVKSWGVAGRDRYWAPFLRVEVESDGAARFGELSAFCGSQGLPVVRAESNGSAR